MKERPILMTPANAQKCHDGTKTQTRRVVKLPADRGTWEPFIFEGSKCVTSKGAPGQDMMCITNTTTGKTIACPYGQVGDRLWVREAWCDMRGGGFDVTHTHKGIEDADSMRCREEFGYKWKPSIHMRRWACRTVLEITDLWGERLQDISEEDALAEGVTGPHMVGYPAYRIPGDSKPRYSSAVAAYKHIWESINGKGSWERNDLVWVVSFAKVQEV